MLNIEIIESEIVIIMTILFENIIAANQYNLSLLETTTINFLTGIPHNL